MPKKCLKPIGLSTRVKTYGKTGVPALRPTQNEWQGSRLVKTRNSGQWTEARYRSFVRSALRQAWVRWPPNQNTKKQARVSRGRYRCAGWGREPHEVGASVVVEGKRKNNVFTDHIEPIGAHETWDQTIERMFCEQDNLQALCRECHNAKTKAERAAAKEKA